MRTEFKKKKKKLVVQYQPHEQYEDPSNKRTISVAAWNQSCRVKQVKGGCFSLRPRGELSGTGLITCYEVSES